MLNSKRIENLKSSYVDTKEFLNFLKDNLKENYEEFIMDKTVELFENIKFTKKFLPCVEDVEFEINNYDLHNNTLESLLGSKKILWTLNSFECDIVEVLVKLDFLGVKRINLDMFYEIINFLLLEKVLLFEQVGFKSILELQEKIYYSILIKGVDNSKIQINQLKKKIKYSNLKIIKRMNQLSIIKDKVIFTKMKIILENRYIGLDYRQFIYLLFPEFYCKSNKDLFKDIKQIEGGIDKELIGYIESFEVNDDIQDEVALFTTKSIIKKIIRK